MFPSHCPGVVHCGPDPILAKAGLHSQCRDLLNYGQRSLVLLLQLVVALCTSFLPSGSLEEQLPNLKGRSTTSRHLSCTRPSDDGITTWW